MNLTYSVITVVGVLVAISLALIVADPDQAPESRAAVIPETVSYTHLTLPTKA